MKKLILTLIVFSLIAITNISATEKKAEVMTVPCYYCYPPGECWGGYCCYRVPCN